MASGKAPSAKLFAVCIVFAAAGAQPLLAEPWAGCAAASDFYDEAGLHADVQLGSVSFKEPIGENGTANPLNILDCDADGTLELFITVSPEAAEGSPARPAEMRFRRGACDEGSPTIVSFVFTQGGFQATWSAYDAGGDLVDVETSSVSGTKQSVVLAHPNGIARVVIAGIRLCIERVCWDCGRGQADGDGCVDPADHLEGADTFSVAHLGPVTVTEATFPTGGGAPLVALDCTNDGARELYIRWSENPEAPARIHLPLACGKNARFPEVVAITFTQGAPAVTWNAYDSAGQLADSAVTVMAPASQTVVLTHASGIRRVEVLGSPVCIDEICWQCELRPSGPTFRRGDAGADGDLSLSDAARTLSFLFLGGVKLSCLDAADADDDGIIQLNDAIRVLNFLFLGGPQPPGSGACAADPTADDLGCESYPPCAV